ncbi:hypothetical protein NYP18_08950 [Corynebacterium sp. YIM 101645]|uniref:Uncharacterized protein n=1 Tax=Corynebacterium lemuris TaxID=1859292 RepID=A0ABT2FXB0_9CORY|nr:hypothetical protein [Corynebacterium lemuris]MCS5479786.1 hypothetical protein [Corynebacterium lemuris]
MTDQERHVHAQVTHAGTHSRDAMLRVAAGKKVNKQTIASLENRGWITHDDYTSIQLTEDGVVALRIIQEEYR